MMPKPLLDQGRRASADPPHSPVRSGTGSYVSRAAAATSITYQPDSGEKAWLRTPAGFPAAQTFSRRWPCGHGVTGSDCSWRSPTVIKSGAGGTGSGPRIRPAEMFGHGRKVVGIGDCRGAAIGHGRAPLANRARWSQPLVTAAFVRTGPGGDAIRAGKR
jgi:hypothetical protein